MSLQRQIGSQFETLRKEARNATAYAESLRELLVQIENKSEPLNHYDRRKIRQLVNARPEDAYADIQAGMAREIRTSIERSVSGTLSNFMTHYLEYGELLEDYNTKNS